MRSAAPPERSGPLAPLRHRSFSLLFGGQLTSALGDQAFALALPWTVIAVTGDPVQAALVLAAEAVPRVLLLPLGGVLADNINPRVVMLVSDIGRAGVVGALGVTLLSGLPPLWVVALLAALQGVGSGLFLPGSQSILPRTVKSAELPAANGLMQIIYWMTMVIGPVLGAFAVAAQAAIAFLLDAASFAVSAITLAGIRLAAPDTPAARASGTQEGQPSHLPAGSTEHADSTEETATATVSQLMLTTTTRLAVVQFVVEEIAPEEIAPKGAPSERSPDSTQVETATDAEPAIKEMEDVEEVEASHGAVVYEAGSLAGVATLDKPVEVLPADAIAEAISTQQARSGALSAMGAGVAYAFGQPLMRATLAVSILGNLAYTGTFGIALILLSRSLDPNPVTLGLLLGACGVGGVLGGLMASVVGRMRLRGLLILVLWLIMAAALALVPIYAGAAAKLPFPIDLSVINFGDVTLGGVHLGALNIGERIMGLTTLQRLLAIALLLGLASAIIALGETVLITIIQQRVPPGVMARAFSVQFMAAGVMQPLSLVAVGFLSATYGAGIAFIAAGALFFIAAVIGLSSSALRRA